MRLGYKIWLMLLLIGLFFIGLKLGSKYENNRITPKLKTEWFEKVKIVDRDYSIQEINDAAHYLEIEQGTSFTKCIIQVVKKLKELERSK